MKKTLAAYVALLLILSSLLVGCPLLFPGPGGGGPGGGGPGGGGHGGHGGGPGGGER